MTTAIFQRLGFIRRWFADWSWPERLIVLGFWLLPIVTLFYGGLAWSGLAGLFALFAFIILHFVVWQHGGWRLFGPHFYYDVVRLARRGQSNRFRIAYLIALFIGLIIVFEDAPTSRAWTLNDFARISEHFSFVLFLVQGIAVLILTPAYVASAIPEEKERRTLELLFTTHLSNTEIVLGILFSRIIHLVGFVLAGFPILCVIQFWGGIDMVLLTGNLCNTLLNIVTVGSICLAVSSMCKTVAGGVMTSYILILPVAFGCMGCLKGAPFVLHDARTAGPGCLTVQLLGLLFIVHAVITVFCVSLAMVTLRQAEPFAPVTIPPASERRKRQAPVTEQTPSQPEPAATAPTPVPQEKPRPLKLVREPERLDAFAIPYTLPPVADNALLWKERFLGGPTLAFSPVVLVPMVPFGVSGTILMTVWFLRALFLDRDDFLRSLEMWSAVLRFFYYVFLGCFLVGSALRTTASVARERQQKTLEPLLLLPVERRDILSAKWLGSLWRGWPWLALLLGDVVIGALVGVYHPFSAVLLCLAPWPLILFLTTFSLLVSVSMHTVLRANLTMVLVLIALLALTAVNVLGQSPLTYLETFTFSWWLPHREEMLERTIVATFMMVSYLIGAVLCWKLAVKMFESRSRHSE